MTDAELIAQLRRSKGWPTLGHAAADRIEALAALHQAAVQDALAAEAYAEELEAANKRLNDQMDAIEEMGTESLNALPDCLMRLAPALVENGELKAKLAKAEWLLTDALVQLREGKIKTRRNRADLICNFLAELKGSTND